MREVTPSTPENSKPNTPVTSPEVPHSGNLPAGGGREVPVHQSDVPLRQADTTIPDTTASFKPTAAELEFLEARRAGQATETTEHKTFWTKRKIGAALLTTAGLAAVFGIGKAVSGGTSTAATPQPTTASAPAVAGETPTPTASAEATPKPEANDSQTGDELVAARYLEESNEEFSAKSFKDRQLAVDGVFAALPAQTGGYKASFFFADTLKGEKQFDTEGERDLMDFNPADIAFQGVNNRFATAQDIGNQLVFARAVALGQLENPDDRNDNTLDPNAAANMLSGLYYDTSSPGAEEKREFINISADVQKIGEKSFVKASSILSSSDEILLDTARELDPNASEPLEYKVINYNDGNGDKWVIVTPVETTFEGTNPYTLEKESITIIKWLIVAEGEGTQDTQGNLALAS